MTDDEPLSLTNDGVSTVCSLYADLSRHNILNLHVKLSPLYSTLVSRILLQCCLYCKHKQKHSLGKTRQESPAIADKPARRESLPKLLQFDVPTTLSLTILAYLHAFNWCCVRNPRNHEKFTENSNLWSSRSSKVIDLGANRKPICDLLLVTH